MKRTLENTFGSTRSLFQPVSQKTRVDASSYPTTVPPGLGSSQPVMRSIASRVPVQIVWQNVADSSSELVPSPQAEPPSSAKNFIEAKAVELRRAILTGNHAVIYAILGGPEASEIALATDVDGQNALFYAIGNNDLLAMDYLLTLPVSGKLVLQKSNQGKVPLSVAAQMGSVVSVQQLLQLDSVKEQISMSLSPTNDLSRGNPLIYAIDKGHEAVVKILLASPDAAPLAQGKTTGGFNSLALAAYRGHEAVVSVLLSSPFAAELAHGSDARSVNALMAATYKDREAIVKILLKSPFAEELLQGRNEEGFNVLMIAAQNGSEAVIRVLLTSGYGETLVKAKNCDGVNALLLSVCKGHAATTNALLEFGFVEQQLDVTYQGFNTLAIALGRRHHSVADVLRRYGAAAARGIATVQPVPSFTPRQ